MTNCIIKETQESLLETMNDVTKLRESSPDNWEVLHEFLFITTKIEMPNWPCLFIGAHRREN